MNADNIHEQFINIDHYYGKMLLDSINILEQNCSLKKHEEKFYNYLLLDAAALFNLLNNILDEQSTTIDDLVVFKTIIIYVGKGCNLRKHSHFSDSFKILTGVNEDIKVTKRIQKILNIWRKGGGVIALELQSNSNHYISMCRENAMIRSVGQTLTNIIHGTEYGAMKTTWTPKETKLYGDMLLFFALKKCITDPPTSFLPNDVFTKATNHSKKYPMTNYELKGILDYFIEM